VKELTQVINIVTSYSSGVATVGHGWARAHPNSAGWFLRFAQILRVFLE